MLRRVEALKHLPLGATDGEIGRVADVYFDDHSWTIRYLVVSTGGWLSDRKVLITPVSILDVSWEERRIDVALSQDQVRNSPDIDTDQPVYRQHETMIYKYYGYPHYWEGPHLWGPTPHPRGAADPMALDAMRRELTSREIREREKFDPHLRSVSVFAGSSIEATDGPVGAVEELLFDDESWAIQFFVVDTRKWLPGKHVLVDIDRVERLSWGERRVHVALSREAVRESPEYEPTAVLASNGEPEPPGRPSGAQLR